jgi:hypothetical protein
MAIYQDSAQNASTPLSVTLAGWMLDYYRDYGRPVIESYFEGTTDLNVDGKILVLVSPVVESGTAAFVWSGDFFPRTQCAASNQMELVRFNYSVINAMSGSSPNYQALATLVHEVKHISSLYKSIVRGDYQPVWVEEGTAELAGEMSSRLAWEAAGGPAVQAMIRRSDKVVTKESYGVLLRLARTIGYLGSQPNGIVVTPQGAGSGHDVYGSGWHFHRWLGDAYGGASTRLADTLLFRSLNASSAPSGILGIELVGTGRTWAALLEEYAAAVLANGTATAGSVRSFTSYDFPSITAGLLVGQRPGSYPWPVNLAGTESSAPFASGSFTGAIGSGGIQVFDLTSDGTGLGLEVKVQSAQGTLRIVVVRIQ